MAPGEDRDAEPARFAVLCALGRELGGLRECVVGRRRLAGHELLELELEVPGGDLPLALLACVSGVGKVRAASAAAALIAAGGSRGLFVVGVCGALRRGLGPGDLVHCTTAVQADLAIPDEREKHSDPRLRAAWRAAAPGAEGWFVTADRPVLNPWRRARLARAFLGPCVADMETAAAAAVAHGAGVPWAALRAVSDHAGFGASRVFREHFPHIGGRAADTLRQWLPSWPDALLEAPGRSADGPRELPDPLF